MSIGVNGMPPVPRPREFGESPSSPSHWGVSTGTGGPRVTCGGPVTVAPWGRAAAGLAAAPIGAASGTPPETAR